MRHMSLFSGVGCVDKAAADLGMDPVATAEIEPFPCRVLAERFPGVPNLGDVTTIDPYEVARTYGRVDVISGGFPCQDLSVAGKRRGLAGDRSGLFWEFVRICRGIAPTWVVLENVPGLLSSNEGRDFALIIDALGELGYGLSWRVLNAQHFGVPQRRRRVFIVGYLGGPCPPEILFESQSVQGNLEEGGEERQKTTRRAVPSVEATLGGGSGNRGWADDTDRMTFVPEVAGGLTTRYGKGVNTTADDGAVIPVSVRGEGVDSALTSEGHDASADGGGRGTPVVGFYSTGGTHGVSPVEDGSPALKQGTGLDIPSPPAVAFNWQASGADSSNPHHGGTDALHAGQTPAVAFAENQRGEVRTSETHPQLTAGGGKPGQGYPAVAQPIPFDTTQITSDKNYSRPREGDPCHPLAAGAHPPALAFTERTRKDGRNFEASEELAYALCNPGSGGRTHSRQLVQGMAVRRLTPTECARLTGMPDDWLDIEGSSDSAKYRAWGNAIVYPVARWILGRLKEVHEKGAK